LGCDASRKPHSTHEDEDGTDPVELSESSEGRSRLVGVLTERRGGLDEEVAERERKREETERSEESFSTRPLFFNVHGDESDHSDRNVDLLGIPRK